MFTTVLSGLWLGMSLGVGKVVSPQAAFTALIFVPLSWLLFPRVLIAVGVTLLAWYLPLRIESSRRLRFVAAIATFVAWLAIATWTFSSWG
jgi:hypothetical protein